MRLKVLKPGLATLRPALAARPSPDGGRVVDRDKVQPWRAWYKTARWQRLRWQVLVRDAFTCRMCARVEGKTRLLVADHIEPHRGDPKLFWWQDNLQCLCKACHDSAKQREERAQR
jgi:5-methylcytosine-specific restriction endonuclease McrA